MFCFWFMCDFCTDIILASERKGQVDGTRCFSNKSLVKSRQEKCPKGT